MKEILYRLIYNDKVNAILRPFAKAIYIATGKKIFSPSGTINLKYKKASFKLETNQTSFVAQSLFYNGTSAYEFTPLFDDLIRKSSVFFDIGANIGYFSILADKLNPDCQTVAFEPSIGSLHYLRKNIELNKSKSVVVIDSAVSNIEGTLLFNEITNSKYPWIKYNLNGSNSLAGEHIKSTFCSYDVQVITIEKVIEKLKLTQVDLIKLDTECTEHLILNSSIEVIQKHLPIIISEVYPVIESEIEEIILHKLSDYIIFQYNFENCKLIKIKSFSHIANTDPDRNFVFCPINKLELIQKYIS